MAQESEKDRVLSIIDKVLGIEGEKGSHTGGNPQNHVVQNDEILQTRENIVIRLVHAIIDDSGGVGAKGEKGARASELDPKYDITGEVNSIVYNFSKEDKIDLLLSILSRIANDPRFAYLVAVVQGVILEKERELKYEQQIAMASSNWEGASPNRLSHNTSHSHLPDLNELVFPSVGDAWNKFESAKLDELTESVILSAEGLVTAAVIISDIKEKTGLDIVQRGDEIAECHHDVMKELKEKHGIEQVDYCNKEHQHQVYKVWNSHEHPHRAKLFGEMSEAVQKTKDAEHTIKVGGHVASSEGHMI